MESRSANNVVSEIERLIQEFDVGMFNFVDDNFFGPGSLGQKRVSTIADEIIKRNLDIVFSASGRVNDVLAAGSEILRRLKLAGLSNLFVGIESANDNALQRYNKGTTVKMNKKAIDLLKELGINYSIGFIMFDPYTTIEELLKNVKFLREIGIYKKSASTVPYLNGLAVLPGTDMERKLKREGLLQMKNRFQLTSREDVTYEFIDKKAQIAVELISQYFAQPLFRKLDRANRILRNHHKLLQVITQCTEFTEADLIHTQSLKGPLVLQLDKWFAGIGLFVLETFEQVLEKLSKNKLDNNLLVHLKTWLNQELVAYDKRYLPMDFDQVLTDLHTLTSGKKINFKYNNCEYSVSIEQIFFHPFT